MSKLKKLLGEIVTSKKALATIASVSSLAAKRAGWDIPEEQLGMLMGALGAYVLGQGIADSKKMSAEELTKTVHEAINAHPIGKSARAEWDAKQAQLAAEEAERAARAATTP